jgi:hypothetical protein
MKNGKTHAYWSLMESYRTAQGSRQRAVACLGKLGPSEQLSWVQLGRHLSGREAHKKPEPTLFDVPAPAPTPDAPVLVRLSGVRVEHLRDVGDVWVGWGLWRMLGRDGLLEERSPRGRKAEPWSTMAAILTLARFCEPSSELHPADRPVRLRCVTEPDAAQKTLLGLTLPRRLQSLENLPHT